MAELDPSMATVLSTIRPSGVAVPAVLTLGLRRRRYGCLLWAERLARSGASAVWNGYRLPGERSSR